RNAPTSAILFDKETPKIPKGQIVLPSVDQVVSPDGAVLAPEHAGAATIWSSGNRPAASAPVPPLPERPTASRDKLAASSSMGGGLGGGGFGGGTVPAGPPPSNDDSSFLLADNGFARSGVSVQTGSDLLQKDFFQPNLGSGLPQGSHFGATPP